MEEGVESGPKKWMLFVLKREGKDKRKEGRVGGH
jgi:hypothetical protein